jgi:hypothetical protein
MRIVLVRDTFTKTTTLGKISIDGAVICETLEDTDRKLEDGGEKVYGETAIPRGTYKIIIDYSQRFHRDLPRLLDVPQFEGIRIHPGNTHVDTHGCILPGSMRINDNSVGYSRSAFNDLFNKLEAAFEKGEDITIEVK